MNGERILDLIRKALPRPGLPAVALFAVQMVYTVIFFVRKLPGYEFSLAGAASLVFSLFTLLLLGAVIEMFVFHRSMVLPVAGFAVFMAWALSAYHNTSGSALDYSLVRDNIGISFSTESFSMISTAFGASDLLLLLLITGILYAAVKRYSYGLTAKRNSPVSGIAALLLWMLMVSLPLQAGDEFTMFAKSALAYGDDSAGIITDSGGYPLYRRMVPHTDFYYHVPRARRRPNVILILIESYNANFVETVAPDGKAYTPNFNSLIKKGMYVDRFYGNSIQTCKGQEALFFSVIPSYRGKLFVDYPGLNISGFPAVLASAGYRTIFFQAYHDLKFDNTYDSMIKAGFDTVKSYAEFRKKEDRPSIWGWGVEDRVFYERFFEFLDREHALTPDKPLFASLMTVATHIPCDGMPPEKMEIFKNPKEIREKYSNALRLSDSQLPRFFELLESRDYLKNTVVIITADHSFPMKEHGIYNNEKCFYDETFRIPFLILWDGVVEPERVSGRAYSQVDIGPTILDMLGIFKADNIMAGVSVFGPGENTVYLVQPYNGRYLQVLNYPYKYIHHVQSGREYLFNLDTDPGERNNLAAVEQARASDMRMSLDRVHLNQRLMDENRLWPVKGANR